MNTDFTKAYLEDGTQILLQNFAIDKDCSTNLTSISITGYVTPTKVRIIENADAFIIEDPLAITIFQSMLQESQNETTI